MEWFCSSGVVISLLKGDVPRCDAHVWKYRIKQEKEHDTNYNNFKNIKGSNDGNIRSVLCFCLDQKLLKLLKVDRGGGGGELRPYLKCKN